MERLPQTITTLDIAEMLEVRHSDILTKLRGNKRSKGIVKILSERNISSADFFQESSYTDEQGKERPCYKVTKLGCDFLANKFNGEKGVVFTARYVKRFADMEQALQPPQPAIETDIFANWGIPDTEPTPPKLMTTNEKTWFERNNWKLKIICERFGWNRKFLYHKILVELSDMHNLQTIENMYISSYGTKPAYKMDLLDFHKALSETATNYINYLLIEEI